jgi:hypothetical protein
MQLDRMPNWLRALVVIGAALMGGAPTAAWAHLGHDHAVQSSGQRPVGNSTAVHRAIASTHAERAVRFVQSVLGELFTFRISPAATECPAPSSEAVRDRPHDGLSADPGALRAKIPGQPLQQTDCCCGGIACHAGMDIPTLTTMDHFVFGGMVQLSPVSAMAGAKPDGIERPPRGLPL